jgi:putative DNA primase/helicase
MSAAPGDGVLTDLAASERLAAANADRLRHVRGLGWLAWDTKRWAPGEDEAHRAAKRNANELLIEAADGGDAKRAAAAARLCGEPRIRGALALATTDERVSITPDQLDADPRRLNVGNGVVDLRDGSLAEHDPSLHLTKIAGADYVPGDRSDRWDRLLDRATGGDTEFARYLQRAAGYTATGLTSEEVALFMHGPGASGKTTFIEALRAALGDYATVADFATFLAARSDGDGPTPGVARLAGARMVCASEVAPGQRFNPARLKALTGGERIVARQLHRDPFEFAPAFTLWLAANDKPAISAADDAAWRRLRLLPFTHAIPASERDPALKRALVNDPFERAAILAWIVAGAVAWHKEGLGTCAAVERATASYHDENDPLAAWLTARCNLTPDASTAGRDLRDDYERWSRHSGEDPCSPQAFAQALEAHGLRRKRTRDGALWQGIRTNGVTDVTHVTDQTGTCPTRARMGENRTTPSHPAHPSHPPQGETA